MLKATGSQLASFVSCRLHGECSCYRHDDDDKEKRGANACCCCAGFCAGALLLLCAAAPRDMFAASQPRGHYSFKTLIMQLQVIWHEECRSVNLYCSAASSSSLCRPRASHIVSIVDMLFACLLPPSR